MASSAWVRWAASGPPLEGPALHEREGQLPRPDGLGHALHREAALLAGPRDADLQDVDGPEGSRLPRRGTRTPWVTSRWISCSPTPALGSQLRAGQLLGRRNNRSRLAAHHHDILSPAPPRSVGWTPLWKRRWAAPRDRWPSCWTASSRPRDRRTGRTRNPPGSRRSWPGSPNRHRRRPSWTRRCSGIGCSAPGSVAAPSDDSARLLIEVLRLLDDQQLAPATLAVREPSMDDVFLVLTGHRRGAA